jgi:hypothetical protein
MSERLFDGKTLRQIHEEKWAELSDDVKTRAVELLRNEFPLELKQDLQNLIAKNPDNWIGMEHFGWGMAVRNFLRTNGLTDDLTPDRNWDDYYIKAIEEAVR